MKSAVANKTNNKRLSSEVDFEDQNDNKIRKLDSEAKLEGYNTRSSSKSKPEANLLVTPISARKKAAAREDTTLSKTNDNVELPKLESSTKQLVKSEVQQEETISSLIKVESSTVEKDIFADPTLDVAFKMLFGQEQNKDLLVSLLNSLLNFEGEEEITDVEISNNELIVSQILVQGQPGIAGAVDILCTNKGKQKIAIEIQGQKQPYFLARMQEYMAKMISSQVKKGEGALYHKKVLKTYILVLGKNNLFVGDTVLKDEEQFELTVVPTVVETGEEVPGNKMCWKFYEFQKFLESEIYRNMSIDSPIKYQWLEFLLDCSKKVSSPTDRAELIQKGYEIMKKDRWTPEDKIAYEMAVQKERDAAAAAELEKQEARKQGIKEGLQKGLEEGRKKEKQIGNIEKVKLMQDLGFTPTKIKNKIPLLTEDQIRSIYENPNQDENSIYESFFENSNSNTNMSNSEEFTDYQALLNGNGANDSIHESA